MRLLLDIGNTRIKWGAFVQGRVREIGSMHHCYDWQTVVSRLKLEGNITTVNIASVAGVEVEQALSEIFKEQFDVQPIFHKSQQYCHGVTNAYQESWRLGVDRWLAIVAAWDRCGSAVCVVDCGTSVTIDFVTDTGCHLGGFILPGLALACSSLLGGTKEVVCDIERSADSLSFGLNTAQAVYNGSVFSVVASIEKAMNAHYEVSDVMPALILSGGDAARIAPHLNIANTVVGALVLEGVHVAGKEV